MTTYTSEAYSAANGLSIMWTYVFSDGEKWTKLDEEYIAADTKIRRRTRVWKQEFEGDTERRSTLKALTAKTSTAAMTSHTVINGAKELADTTPVDGGIIPARNPAPNAEARAAALAEAEQAEPVIELPTYQPGDRVQYLTSPAIYTVVRHRKDGKVRLTSESGRSLVLPDEDLAAAAPALSRSEKRDAAIARAKAEDAARAAETAAAGQKYRTYESYRNAEPAARETVDAVFSALDSAGYVGDVHRGVGIEYPSGSVTASFALPNIGGEPTQYLVGITHDGYLIRLAKYVHTGRMERDEETGEEVPESVWRTVRVHEGERAGDILAPALRDRPALPRWQNAAGY